MTPHEKFEQDAARKRIEQINLETALTQAKTAKIEAETRLIEVKMIWDPVLKITLTVLFISTLIALGALL